MLSERIELVMKTNRNIRPTPSRLSRWSLAAALAGAALYCLTSGPAVTISALPIVELSPGDLPRDAASYPGPEPANAASRGASSNPDQVLRDETLAAIAHDDVRGEDPEVRRAAIEALGDRAGAVLVLDPRTGRILAAVNQDWVFRRGFAPASTIKLVTAVAALDAGAFDPAARVAAQGKRVNLDQAIAYSNTEYFQRIGERVGLERFLGVARAFGYGEATGTNYVGEYAGLLPAAADPNVFGTGASIEVTLAQLASAVSAIANGGDLVSPRVPRGEEFAPFVPVVRRHVDIAPEMLRRLLPGMIGTVKYGTGVKAADSQFVVAGKTGSAEGPEGNTGLFVSFAPAKSPNLAVVVVTRGSKTWGADAAAVAGYIYRALEGRVLC
jgi:cell division protein FtsI/penicillin-binding protein 2